MKNAKRGFTLIELLVVVLIIGILAAVAVPQYQKAVAKARAAEIMLFANAYEKAVASHVLAHGIQETEGYFFSGHCENGQGVRIQNSYELDMELESFLNKACEWGPSSGFDALAIERPDGKIHYELLTQGNLYFSFYNDSTDGYTWTRSCSGETTKGAYICQALQNSANWD